MNYYIYENLQAFDREGPKMHKWNCGHCDMGHGKRIDAKKGKNGFWIGPFEKIEFARNYGILKFRDNITECECIKNK
jgi:hypothetical protein